MLKLWHDKNEYKKKRIYINIDILKQVFLCGSTLVAHLENFTLFPSLRNYISTSLYKRFMALT